MKLVYDARNLKHVVEAMIGSKRPSKKYVQFSNVDDTIQFILFADSIGNDIFIDVEFVDAIRNQKAIDVLTETEDPEEDDFYKLMTFRVAGDEAQTLKRYQDIVEEINDVYMTTICSCGKRFKYRDDDVCMLCILQCPHNYADVPLEFCAVCQEHTRAMGMIRTTCCKNYIHPGCKHRLIKCPYCRDII
jgi:hypothetical protein